MNKKIEANRKLWNELTSVHLKGSQVYPIEAFKKGKNVLNDIEVEEVGDVAGKSMLHLQCHFGMDTLSWARLGAEVTGVDFSDEAIKAAKNLAAELEISAKFILSDIFTLTDKLKGEFDIVFASYGALYWISDIEKWIQIASSYLKKGGFLYIVDGHPFYHWLNRDETQTDLAKFEYSYFDRTAQRYNGGSDYADPSHIQTLPEYGWHFTISDLINSVSNAGLRINKFNEFPSFKIRKDGEIWKPIGDNKNFPVMFSIKATR